MPISKVTPLEATLSLPWLLHLRWWSAVGQIAGVGYLGLSTGDYSPLSWIIIATLVISNFALSRWQRSGNKLKQSALATILIVDLFLLTTLLSLSGGAANPFSILFLFYVTLSAITLGRMWTWVLVATSCMCFGILFLTPEHSDMHSGHHEAGFAGHLYGMWVAFAFAAALIASFLTQVIKELREKTEALGEMALLKLRQEQLSSLASLSAGAAHELSTPLSTIMLVAEEMKGKLRDSSSAAETFADAVLVASEVERCRSIIQKMSANGGQLLGELEEAVLPAELVEQLIRSIGPKRAKRLTIEIQNEARRMLLPRLATVQSLEALISNALDASKEEASVSLRIRNDKNEISFEVIDSGTGIASEHLPRLCEPFFTLKEPGKGMGLGLFLVSLFVERVNGKFDVLSEVNSGTSAVIRIPRRMLRRAA